MSFELVLQRRKEGLPLSARTINHALMQISEEFGIRSELSDCTKLIHFRLGMRSEAKSATVEVNLTKTGSKLVGTTPPMRSALLAWCFHSLARRLGCELVDPKSDERGPRTPNPKAYVEEAKSAIRNYEDDVLAGDSLPGDEFAMDSQLVEFLDWLVEQEKLSLACKTTAELVRQIELDDESIDLYESLLESPAVDEIFASEEEFAQLIKQYRDAPVRGTRPSAA